MITQVQLFTQHNGIYTEQPKCDKTLIILTATMILFVIAAFFFYFCKSENCDYELVAADVRNIIFVGKGRVGKSTLIQVLKNKDHDPGLFDIVRGTKYATVESFTMRSDKLNNNLHFNIMDTPGLFERTVSLDDKRTNDVILDVIKKCIDMEITKINHVYFVMSVQYGLNPEDIESFKLFSELFVGMEDKMSIIISFAQTISTEQQYAHYINQFQKVPELKPLYSGGRIFFLGAVQKSEVMDTEKLQENVYKQRTAVFEHIISQSSSFNVKKLKVYKDNLSFLGNLRETLSECCNSMKNCVDVEKFDRFVEHYTPKVIGELEEVKEGDDEKDANVEESDDESIKKEI